MNEPKKYPIGDGEPVEIPEARECGLFTSSPILPPEHEISLQMLLHRLIELEEGQDEIKETLSKINTRVTELEITEKITRWVIGGVALLIGYVAKPVISYLVEQFFQ